LIDDDYDDDDDDYDDDDDDQGLIQKLAVTGEVTGLEAKRFLVLLTVNFACNFARGGSEYAERSVRPQHLQTSTSMKSWIGP